MTTTLFLLQHVDRCLEVIMRSDSSWVYNNHTALDFFFIDTAEKKTYVVTCFTFVKNLTEHFNSSNYRLLVLTKTKQLNFIANLTTTSLDTTSCYSTTTCDREYILNRHQERFINLTCRFLNPVVNCFHQLHNAVFPLSNTIQRTKSRTRNNRSIFFVSVRSQKILNIHLNEVNHFLVNFWVITLVQEYNQTRYVHLTCKKNVLTCLRHRTISSSNNKNCTVHLSSTSYHVLHIVGVTRTVNVSVVTICSFILNVGSINGNTTLLLLRSIVNLIE